MRRGPAEADRGAVVDAAHQYYSELEGMAPQPQGLAPLSMVGSGPMQEDQVSIKSDDYSAPRVKLMCSHGGRILPRPVDGHLRYVGGETRIVVVNRNITYADLVAKLAKLFVCSLSVKYQLPNEDLDTLVSVLCDEDLENMMEEYDRLEGREGPARLRLFLFPAKQTNAPTPADHVNDSRNSEQRYMDAINGVPTQLPRKAPQLVPDYLFGLDTVEHWDHERVPAVTPPVFVASTPPQVVQPTVGVSNKADSLTLVSSTPLSQVELMGPGVPTSAGMSEKHRATIQKQVGYLAEMFQGQFANSKSWHQYSGSLEGSQLESIKQAVSTASSAMSRQYTLDSATGTPAVDYSHKRAWSEPASLGHSFEHSKQNLTGEDDTSQKEGGSSNLSRVVQEPIMDSISAGYQTQDPATTQHPEVQYSKPRTVTPTALLAQQTGGRPGVDPPFLFQAAGEQNPQTIVRASDLVPLQASTESPEKQQGSAHSSFDSHRGSGDEMDAGEKQPKYWRGGTESLQQEDAGKLDAPIHQVLSNPNRIEKKVESYSSVEVQHPNGQLSEVTGPEIKYKKEHESLQGKVGEVPHLPTIQQQSHYASQETIVLPSQQMQPPHFQVPGSNNHEPLSHWPTEHQQQQHIQDPSSPPSHLARSSQFSQRNLAQSTLQAPGGTVISQRAGTAPTRGMARTDLPPRPAIPSGAHVTTVYHRQSSLSHGEPRMPSSSHRDQAVPRSLSAPASSPATPSRFRDSVPLQSEERILRGPPLQQQPVTGSRPISWQDDSQVITSSPCQGIVEACATPALGMEKSSRASASQYKGVNPFQEVASFPDSSDVFQDAIHSMAEPQGAMALTEGRRHAVIPPSMRS